MPISSPNRLRMVAGRFSQACRSATPIFVTTQSEATEIQEIALEMEQMAEVIRDLRQQLSGTAACLLFVLVPSLGVSFSVGLRDIPRASKRKSEWQ